MPEGKDDPSAFIVGPAEGKPDVYVIGYAEDGASEDGNFNFECRIGEIVKFAWRDQHGGVPVTFAKDGTFKAHGEVPAFTTCWIAGDFETTADSLAELAKFIAEDWDYSDFDEGESEVVRFASWNQDDENFRLELHAEGARFVRVTTPGGGAQ
jgi:hypothetical protein